MKITLLQTIYHKWGREIEFFGFENPTHKISEQSTLRWKKTLILINNLFRRMRRRALIFGAEYFCYPDSNSQQTLIFE